MSRDITLADTIYILFTTRAFATGIPTVLAGTPVVSAYEDSSLTQITAGITLGVDHDSVVGLNLLTIVATGANGYEAGKDYSLIITTGTVDGVSVVGEVVGEFTVGRSAAAVDLANGTDGLGAIKTDTAAILVDTGTTLDARIPAALVGGRIDSDIGAKTGNIPLSAQEKLDVNTEADTAISDATLATAADILDKIGAVSEAAAAGDPSATESVMQYVKQIVNILVGAAGVVTFPAEAAPANAVSLAEVLRAIHSDVTGLAGNAMRGTDSAALASVATETRLAELDAANIPSDVDAILVDTAEIGAAGAGLTAIPWNAAWDTEVQSEVDDALKVLQLDKLLAVAVVGANVTDNSIFAYLVSSAATADWDTFVNTTEALQALRDRGDAAWTTGAGGTPPTTLQNTTIATLASQTSFTLTAGSADDLAYAKMLCIVTDAVTGVQKAVGIISVYTGPTKTVTLREDPGVFTMAVGDTVDVVAITPDLLDILADVAGIAGAAMRGTDSAALASVATEARLAELDAANLPADIDLILADTGELQTDWVNGGRLDLLIDAIKAVTDLLPNAGALSDLAAILVDTVEIGVAGAGLTDLGGMSTGMKAEINIEVDTGWATQMADSVAPDGTISTREQAVYALLQMLTDFAISGTTLTVRKVDGTTTLMTFTLDDATNPVSLTRAT